MIDIRNIEIVTPDIQRQSLIESNNRLKTVTILLFTALVLSAAVCTYNYLHQVQKDEK
ncbi:hypothetical protein [Flavobacterium phycosphaerae]|uniref:hypothetical protein n=1 Tax=Flavobacterium phycosphaerae TaxID=2697515 RepID=UPI00138AE3DA|nr:hypothetical protein [Flavobacterium phycosphaerae]